MWFKRKKKSAQDTALNESLRSLQGLLEERDRAEPKLAPVHPDDQVVEESVDEQISDIQEEQDFEETQLPRTIEPAEKQEEKPSDYNAWRDLSFSFDAEPKIPEDIKQQAQSLPSLENEPIEKIDNVMESENDADSVWNHIQDDTVLQDGDLPKLSVEPTLENSSSEPVEDLTSEEYADWETQAIAEDNPNETASIIEFPEISETIERKHNEEVQTDHESEPDTEIQQINSSDIQISAESQDTDELIIIDTELPSSGNSEASSDAIEQPSTQPKDRREDQLNLELEPDGDSKIPTLTEAIYIPDSTPTNSLQIEDQEAEPEELLAKLKVRLQLKGTELLTDNQEKELREAIAEYLKNH